MKNLYFCVYEQRNKRAEEGAHLMQLILVLLVLHLVFAHECGLFCGRSVWDGNKGHLSRADWMMMQFLSALSTLWGVTAPHAPITTWTNMAFTLHICSSCSFSTWCFSYLLMLLLPHTELGLPHLSALFCSAWVASSRLSVWIMNTHMILALLFSTTVGGASCQILCWLVTVVRSWAHRPLTVASVLCDASFFHMAFQHCSVPACGRSVSSCHLKSSHYHAMTTAVTVDTEMLVTSWQDLRLLLHYPFMLHTGVHSDSLASWLAW